jgi:DNA polymerase-3 subunit delta
VIAVFYGKDDFSAHEALAALASELNADGADQEGLADSTVRVDGRSAKPEELLAICQTMPFLAAYRLVIVTGLLARFDEDRRRGRGARKRKTDEPALGAWQSFVEALPQLPETTTLVFMEGALGKSNPLLKELPKGARVQEFQPLKQAEVAGWINRRAALYGVSIQARAVAALAQLVGNQLWLLDTELQKLATYAAGREITDADVRELVSFARDPNVFAMADAIVEGRTRDAIDLLHRLLADGEAAQKLLVVNIVRQYRLLVLAKELLDQRVPTPEISARLGVRPFVAQRMLQQQAPLYTNDKLRRAYRLLLDADLSMKRGVHDDETALELLIFQLAALATRRQGASPGRPGYNRPPGGRGPAPPTAATA